MRLKSEVVFWIYLILCLLLPVAVFAQETPTPPNVILTSLRYDAGWKVYLLDFVYIRPEVIGNLQISVTDEEGVEVAGFTAKRRNRNQTVYLDARDLELGQQYVIEVTAFTPDGQLIISGQGNAVLVSREFTHSPGKLTPQLSNPLFKVDPEGLALRIELAVRDGDAIVAYRVILLDNATNTVVLDVRGDPVLPLVVPLEGVPAGEYEVQIQARDAMGNALAGITGEFTYNSGTPALGQPLFDYVDDPPVLNIRLQPQDGDEIARYAVSLVDTDTNAVILDFQNEAGPEPLLTVPLDTVPAGTYQVIIRALDAGGHILATTEEETTYRPAAKPGLLTRIGHGLLANPYIPLLIVLVLVSVVGWLILRAVGERRATATPLLENWSDVPGKPPALPMVRTLVFKSPDADRPSTTPALPPPLQVTVTAAPDARQVGQTVRVAHYPFTIGRGGCNLDLSGDTHISRRHAELRLNREGLFIVDLLSRNGTYVDGERIAAEVPTPLDPSAQTRLGIGRETYLVLEPAGRG